MYLHNPDTETCLKMYNMMDSPVLCDAMKYLYKSVKQHKVIYLPMLLKPFTADSLKDLMTKFEKDGVPNFEELKLIDTSVDPKFQKLNRSKYDKSKFVQVRILSNTKFPVDWSDGTLTGDVQEIPAIIIQAH